MRSQLNMISLFFLLCCLMYSQVRILRFPFLERVVFLSNVLILLVDVLSAQNLSVISILTSMDPL